MEYVKNAKLTLHIETNKRTIHKEFNNYAELFDYGTMILADLTDGSQMYTHTDKQWANRGENYKDFSDGNAD